jgi:hypothetical protein
VSERQQRRTRLTPEQKWQIFLESSRKNSTDAEVCRRWGSLPGSCGGSASASRRAPPILWKGAGTSTQGRSDDRAGAGGGADLQGPKEVVLTFPWVARR